jgi:hypothetical protein
MLCSSSDGLARDGLLGAILLRAGLLIFAVAVVGLADECGIGEAFSEVERRQVGWGFRALRWSVRNPRPSMVA